MKTYPVIIDQKRETQWSKKDFTERGITRSLRGLDRVEIGTDLVMIYKKGIKGGDGKIFDYAEERVTYSRIGYSNQYAVAFDNTTK